MFNWWAERDISRQFSSPWKLQSGNMWGVHFLRGKVQRFHPLCWEGKQLRSDYVEKCPAHLVIVHTLVIIIIHRDAHLVHLRHSAHLSLWATLTQCVLRKVSTKSSGIMRILCWAIDEDQMSDYGQKYARRPVLRQSKVTDVLWKVRPLPLPLAK